MDPNEELPVFELLGEAGIAALVAGFYRRVPTDPVLGPMYPPHDLAGAEQRLAAFLVYRFGGPPRYIQQRGHPRLRQRHAPFPIDQAAAARWMLLMEESMREQGLAPAMVDYLRAFLGDIATFLVNR